MVMQNRDAIIACGMQKGSTELELSTPTFEIAGWKHLEFLPKY